ncbi:MAG: tyrosine-type recombinase/integrase, partial [Rhodosalinus sp.]
RWCVAEGLIARGDPFAVLELPKTPAALPAGLFTAEQIAALLAVPDVATPLGLRNRTLLELTAAVGITGRELAALRLRDSEADTGLVTVRPLDRGRSRTVPLGTAAGRWLRRYLAEARPRLVVGRAQTDALFVSQHGWPLTFSDAAHIGREAARAAGLPTRRVLSALKDSLAVQLLEAGCDPRYLAALFGHADLQSVRKYQRMSVQQLQEVHRRHHPAEREGDADASR